MAETITFDSLDDTRIPLLSESEKFIYPFMITPIFFSVKDNIVAIDYASDNDLPIFISPYKTKETEEELSTGNNKISSFDAGTVGKVIRKGSLPDGRIKVLFQGLYKARITELSKAVIEDEENIEYSVELVKIKKIENTKNNSSKMNAFRGLLLDKLREYSRYTSLFSMDLISTLEDNKDINRVIEMITNTLKLKQLDEYRMFIERDTEKQLLMLLEAITDQIEIAKIKKDLHTKVNSKVENHNKEFYLKEQLKQIQKELGTDNQRNEEIEKYRQKLEAKKKYIPEDGYKEIKKQLDRLARMHPDSSDANTIMTYIEWVSEIPFGELSKRKLDISQVENYLNRDHFSLEKPKERILEFFAVKELIELRGIDIKENKGAILCFVGPPGVGKTSLANSIATALKRSLVRVALGGLEDVNELRGHRRTYVGAMPGRIIQGLIEAKQMNPVMVLDEIDKVGMSHRGDPTSAMLEILDPEQNVAFRDYYLNFSIDLSKIIFIATANDLRKIPTPLKDRMEFIHISSYTPQEKYEIARRYLLPQEIKKHGLKNSEVSISKKALEELIANYTREAGVRNLRRQLATVTRKSAKKILENPEILKTSVTVKNLKDFLEKTVFEISPVSKEPQVGVVYGLAWTAVGGDVLKIEVSRIVGKGAFQITGSLGKVMQESARIAITVVKLLFDKEIVTTSKDVLKDPSIQELIDENALLNPEKSKNDEKTETDTNSSIQVQKAKKIAKIMKYPYRYFDLHIHVPDGSTPKDGPSAGITMTTAIASILSGRKVRNDTAMTGEISLQGEVMPIGGLKEKIIAAHRAGIKYILIPEKNYERDLIDIPEEILKDLDVISVSRIEEVIEHCLI
jgi:ATP-dependent Lon protease